MPSRTAVESSRYSRPSDAQAAADAIPILVGNEYQIFHLTTPHNTVRHPPRLRSTWGRLRSKDLITWERDEVEALYPSKNAQDPDADGVWTGCAIVGPDDKMHIFYTGYNLSQGGKQVILHARSNDRKGTAFSKPLEPMLMQGDRSRFEDIDFRDAHVSWNAAENCYWMLVATRLREGPFWTRGCLALLTSPDLEAWTIDREPLYAPNDMFCPECPEIFTLANGKWYLVYSRFHAPNAGTVYRIADSPRGPFRTPRGACAGRFDARRWYAAKSCAKSGDPSKRVYFGWIADKLDGQWSWGGDMGIPREASADREGNLVIQPSEEFLDSMFPPTIEETISRELKLVTVGRTQIRFLPTSSRCLSLRFAVHSQDAASFGVAIRTDADLAGYRLKLVPIAPDLAEMTLFKHPPPLDDFWADQYNLHLAREVDGPELARHVVKMTAQIVVVLQSDILEVFCDGKSISHRLVDDSVDIKVGPTQLEKDCNGHVNGQVSQPQNGMMEDLDRELGIFVEDGSLDLKQMSLRCR